MKLQKIIMNLLLISVILIVIIQGLEARATSRSSRGIWRQCTNPSSPVHLTHFNIEPNPAILPGDMLFSIEGSTNRTLGSSALHLDIVREGRWFNIPIPCFRKIGSCTYDDMCTMLDDMVNENWMGITRNLAQNIQQMLRRNNMTPGLCPQPPQTVSIRRNRIELPRLPAALYWFAEGAYRANVRVTDNTSGEELVCFDVRINMKQQEEDCSGFWGCVFIPRESRSCEGEICISENTPCSTIHRSFFRERWIASRRKDAKQNSYCFPPCTKLKICQVKQSSWVPEQPNKVGRIPTPHIAPLLQDIFYDKMFYPLLQC